jgi:hypothetical protein
MNPIAIIILIGLMYVVEAFTDFFIIKNQKADNSDSRKWHGFDMMFHFLIMILILALTDNNFLLALLIPSSRWLFFNTILNWLRNKKLWYRGAKEHILLRTFAIPLWLLSFVIYGLNVYLILK